MYPECRSAAYRPPTHWKGPVPAEVRRSSSLTCVVGSSSTYKRPGRKPLEYGVGLAEPAMPLMFCSASVESVDWTTKRCQYPVAEVSSAKPKLYFSVRLASLKES